MKLRGEVTAEIDLSKRAWFLNWLKNIVGGLTGRAVTEINITDTQSIDVDAGLSVSLPVETTNATDYIVEYYTDAPVATEKNTSSGKEVVISGPDNLNYTDVLSYTNIPEILNVGQENVIKIYWKENDSYVPFDAYDLDGNDKLDYIEWITPHLSNQTFEIILITRAIHLDENRAYIDDVYDSVKTLDNNITSIPNGHYIRVTFEYFFKHPI